MRYIKILILGTWFLPVFLLISPFHEYDNKASIKYILLILLVIVFIVIPLKDRKIEIKNSVLKNKFLINSHFSLTILLLCLSLFNMVSLIMQGEGLQANREIFQNNHQVYNYIFVVTVFSVIITSLSSYSSKTYKSFAKGTWLICGFLLLMTGNRQFVFFSLVYLMLYKLGISKNPKNVFFKSIIFIIIVISLAILFSILRLDYIKAGNISAYGKYMATLTGAKCVDEVFCETEMETAFQFLYAYLGMNYSGLTYSIEFNSLYQNFPFLSITFPVIYRRFEFFGIQDYLGESVMKYDNFIAVTTGGNYSHFFATMFGDISIEGGLTSVIFSAIIIFSLLFYYAKKVVRNGHEIDYMIFIFLCANMIFGFLQFPFSEPFVFFGMINLLINSLITGSEKSKRCEVDPNLR